MVAAPTGAGKSYGVGFMVEQLYARNQPVLILDTKQRNHIGLMGLNGFKLLRIREGACIDFNKALRFPYLLCIPDEYTRTADLIEIYRGFMEAAYQRKKPLKIMVEEAHNYNKHPQIPDETLELLTREGRGIGLDLTFITQRIQDFPKLLWAQCKYSYLYKYMIPHDIDYVDRLIPGYKRINRKLEAYDMLEYSHERFSAKVVKARAIARHTKHWG